MQEELSIDEFVLKMAIELVEFKEYDYEVNKNNPSWPFLLTEEDWREQYNTFRASKTASEPFSTPS
jgi:hypothetical protein